MWKFKPCLCVILRQVHCVCVSQALWARLYLYVLWVQLVNLKFKCIHSAVLVSRHLYVCPVWVLCLFLYCRLWELVEEVSSTEPGKKSKFRGKGAKLCYTLTLVMGLGERGGREGGTEVVGRMRREEGKGWGEGWRWGKGREEREGGKEFRRGGGGRRGK